MDYHLYHDESKQAGYWHGMLLVPQENRQEILRLLEQARTNTKYSYALAIKNVNKTTGKIFYCAQSWILIGIGLMRNKLGDKPFAVHYGENIKGNLQRHILRRTLGLKYILFREKHNHTKMEFLVEYPKKVETTFRIGLKGGLNLLSSPENPINIIKIHFDGNEHHGGRVDRERIVGRLYGLRDSCKISNCEDIIDDRTGDHNRSGCQAYEDCQFLQLTDLLLGSFRTFLGECTHDSHRELAHAALFPVAAATRPIKGFRNSRWYGSFCMSQCEVVDKSWVFSSMEILIDDSTIQLDLPF